MRFYWYVLESQSRWSNVVHQFGTRACPEREDRIQISQLTSLREMIDMAESEGPHVLLWELPASSCRDILRAVSQVSSLGHPVFQIVAFDLEAMATTCTMAKYELMLREIGAQVVCAQPSRLPCYFPAIRRFWQMNRGSDNVAIAESIMDQLPWSSPRA